MVQLSFQTVNYAFLSFSSLFLFVKFCLFRITVLFVKFFNRHRQVRGLSVDHQSQRGNTTVKTYISLEFYTQFYLIFSISIECKAIHQVSRSHYLHAGLIADRLWSKSKLW